MRHRNTWGNLPDLLCCTIFALIHVLVYSCFLFNFVPFFISRDGSVGQSLGPPLPSKLKLTPRISTKLWNSKRFVLVVLYYLCTSPVCTLHIERELAFVFSGYVSFGPGLLYCKIRLLFWLVVICSVPQPQIYSIPQCLRCHYVPCTQSMSDVKVREESSWSSNVRLSVWPCC